MLSNKKQIKKQIKNRLDRKKLRIGGTPQKKLSRGEIRRGVLPTVVEPKKFKDYGCFIKNNNVEVDVVFCICSFNRYDKILRMLEQIFSQKTNYTFKLILFNDGSSDERYNDLKNLFPDILYLENKVNGGKINYWKTVNYVWKKASEIESYGIIQLDDDFMLCNNFLDILLDKFFEVKEKSNDYMVFSFHLYNFHPVNPIDDFWFDENNIFVDGGMFLDTQFLKLFNYELDKIEKRVARNTATFTWVRLKEIMIELGVKLYRFNRSLVWHDGNLDSKHHPLVRNVKKIYTKNFIDYE